MGEDSLSALWHIDCHCCVPVIWSATLSCQWNVECLAERTKPHKQSLYFFDNCEIEIEEEKSTAYRGRMSKHKTYDIDTIKAVQARGMSEVS